MIRIHDDLFILGVMCYIQNKLVVLVLQFLFCLLFNDPIFCCCVKLWLFHNVDWEKKKSISAFWELNGPFNHLLNKPHALAQEPLSRGF